MTTSAKPLLVGAIAGAVLGLCANLLTATGGPFPEASGWVADVSNYVAHPIGQVFLRSLFVLVIPLVFSALVMGIVDLDVKELGRAGVRMLLYTVVVSTIAVIIGMVLVHVIQPGKFGQTAALRSAASVADGLPSTTTPSAIDLLLSVIPDNAFKAAAQGDVLGVIGFAILFGIGLAMTKTAPAAQVRELIAGIYDVMMRLIGLVLRLAPLGVGALLFKMTAKLGLGVMSQLGMYVFVVILGLSIHMFVVYSLSVRFLGGRNPIEFFRAIRVAMLTAFSTASSSATLPTALAVAQDNLKIPPKIARFVLTAGSTMNQNGTALFEGVTVLFLAQLYGVELGLAEQATVMVICILAGIGTAGVPAGSLPVIAMILGMFRIPAEGLGLILGVDRLLDMCRTTLNVTGDLAAAVYVAKDVHEPLQGDGSS